MSVELYLLAASVVVGLVYLGFQALLYKSQVGNAASIGARDGMPRAERLAGRAERAFRNFLETYPIFVGLVVLVELSGHSNGVTQWSASVYLGMRVAYLPLYLGGVPWVRTIFWNIATAALAVMLVGVFV